MNGLTIVGLAIVVLGIAYVTYGRYLAKTWGIDPNAKTPAYTKEEKITFQHLKQLCFHINFHQ